MATPQQVRRRGRWSLTLGTILAFAAFAAVAYADGVKNNVATDLAGDKVVTAAAGSTAAVNYKIDQQPAGQDGQSGCNAEDGTPARLSFLGLPSGTTWTPTPFSIDDCSGFDTVTFSVPAGASAGDYNVSVTVSDASATSGSYDTSAAAFKLRVGTTSPPPPLDTDGDGVPNSTDNCPGVANALQADQDGDGIGDVCDSDRDGDGDANVDDNCPELPNADQADADGDALGDACDPNAFAPHVTSDAGNKSGFEGSEITNSGGFGDLDPNATLTITKASGVGTVAQGANGTWTWSQTPADNTLPQTVEVQASDGEHTTIDSFTWTAANVAPTAAITGPSGSSPEGMPIMLGSSVSDPSSADATAGFTRSWSVTKNGAAYGTGASGDTFSFTPNDNGTYVVSFSATDKDGGVGTDSKTITVTNAAPSISAATFGAASGVSCPTPGAMSNSSLTVTFTDGGSADTHYAEIDWNNDGTFEQKVDPYTSGTAIPHLYSSAGSYTAKVKVTDDDGGVSTTSSAPVVVNYNLSGILQPVNDTRNGQQPSMFKYGSTIPVKVEITDCDGSHPSTLDVRVSYRVTSGSTPAGGDDEAVATNAPDSGNQMRFSDPIYIFNLATKAITADASSTVRITVTVGLTSTYADIGLKAK